MSLNDEEDEGQDVPADLGGTTGVKEPQGVLQHTRYIPREHVDPLGYNQRLITTSDMATNEMLPPRDADLYPPHLSGIYDGHRGQDRPTIAQGDTVPIDSVKRSNFVQIYVKAVPNVHAEPVLIGRIKNTEPADTRCLTLMYQMHSQVPGFTIFVSKRGNDAQGAKKPKVQFKYFANMLKKEKTSGGKAHIALEVRCGKNMESAKAAELDTADLCLLETWVRLPSLESVQQGNRTDKEFGLRSCRPILKGISVPDFWALTAEAKKAKSWGDGTLCAADWAIVALGLGNEFNIFRFWSDDPMSAVGFQQFNSFWTAAMKDAAEHGNFPYYQRLAQRQGLTTGHQDFDMTIEKCPPPWHMVTKCRVTSNDQGKVMKIVPEQWHTFEDVPDYPDSETKAFAVRLAIERARYFGKAQIQESLEKARGSMKAKFSRFPPRMNPLLYWVEVQVDNVGAKAGGTRKSIFDDSRKSRPSVKTRIRVTITSEGHPLYGEELPGAVQEDLFATDPFIAAVVRTKPGMEVRFQGTSVWEVSVDLEDDPTSSDRQNAAICELGKGVQRQHGIDLGRLVLLAPVDIPDQDKVHKDVTADRPAAYNAYMKIVESSRLNEKQRIAARTALQQALLLLYGGPGTGKTRTMLAIARGHIEVGRITGNRRKIIACAPSNKACDNMLDGLISAFHGHKDVLKSKFNVCRFKGGFVNPAPKAGRHSTTALGEVNATERARGQDAEGEDEIENRTWEYCGALAQSAKVDIPHLDFYHQRQRSEYIRRCQTAPDHPYSKEALHYFHAVQKYRKDESLGTEAKNKLKQEIRDADDLWDERYFDEEVDIVFCTNNSAAHDTLIRCFKPDILVSDEAALASLPDVATPMAAFKESLITVVIVGDYRQQGPPALSCGANETLRDITRSLFEILQKNPDIPGKVELAIQHRMKSDFSRMVSKIWYKDQLRDHPSLQDSTELQITLKQAWAGLAKAGLWNGRLRMAVSVGSPAHEMKAEGTVSLYNETEADYIVKYVKYLLDFEPRKEAFSRSQGRRVTQDDILIISPYAGQVTMIIMKLIAESVNKVQVVTSAGAQGRESDIVLLSLVRNKPAWDREKDAANVKVGFVSQHTQLCVNFSRVRQHQVTFGNFTDWVEAWRNGDPFMTDLKGKHSSFAKVVQDHVDQGDIISSEAFRALLSGNR
ncbi:hypothetical protein B0A50_05732 [Salinomyces thailandicus]|uniref:Uncharacterized protein n=1 Tax=Salinomyces thailandicus TaxID=706561 RepID=A0A4U0TRK8_9PEZI|nr:hypothetical protein B0A50_05732 [Salinomyces thailandica]